jgi:hypothetical protein
MELIENIIGKDTPLIKGIGNHETLASTSKKRKSEKEHEEDYTNLSTQTKAEEDELTENIDTEIKQLKVKIRKFTLKAQSLENDLFN